MSVISKLPATMMPAMSRMPEAKTMLGHSRCPPAWTSTVRSWVTNTRTGTGPGRPARSSAHCWFTWVLYQCATVTPDAFSFGEPLESGPNETKSNAAATKPINHSQRFTLESFIAVPPFVRIIGHQGAWPNVAPRETLARTLLLRSEPFRRPTEGG